MFALLNKIIKYCYFSSILLLVNSFHIAIAAPLTDLTNGKQRYVYDVFYKKLSVGTMTREFDYQNGDIKGRTTADLSFLFYKMKGYQLSEMYWDEPSLSFLSKSFIYKETGSHKENTTATFFDNGYQSKLTTKGKSKGFKEEGAIVDFHAIGMQMSEGLRRGETNFDFYMQTTEKVKHYYFEVKGKETIETKLGKFETYRLEQTRKNNRTLVIWFAPKINYQMVQFYYKFNLLNLRGNLIKYD